MEPSPDDVRTQLRRGTLEFCVLAHLARGPAYGQDIARVLGADHVLFAAVGTRNPLLRRLRRRGWVDTTWEESPTGPPRRYHRLTDPGRAALDAFVEVWRPYRSAVDRLLEGQPA